ncbi:sulfur-containing amino acid ABC transporter ATP-binding protein TcyN [Secundilactobacillus kimchicus JCM 15530]|uniref:Sulfur-containing amino acid ABC transporter ATP-binding protein TcyN n=1 Tax=Secundilactobacillus kimchicus JCM 15530 TaxID=1302272 RepID=A0A0R1HLQ0_9LACO|nr:sulfur-containing amino acid ABC transporter ATP-binding protein TcyN [Secundilactobacillus kimchicus JCM 15530]
MNGIDLDAKKGEVVTLIGPSGTGKTTLLRTINLLEVPLEGKIEIDDLSLEAPNLSKNDKLALRRKTAMVFQQYNLFKNETVFQNVVQPQLLVKKRSKIEAHQIAIEALKQVGMQDYLKSYPSQLSGGQQQRVSIARALALNPEVILFDEPTSALDPELSQEVLTAIRKVKQAGITIILATHEMRFAEEISDQVVFMEKGIIVENGTPEQIFHHPQKQRTQAFLKHYVQLPSIKTVDASSRFSSIKKIKVV